MFSWVMLMMNLQFYGCACIQMVCYVLKHTVSVWRRDLIYESKKKHDHLRNLRWALEKDNSISFLRVSLGFATLRRLKNFQNIWSHMVVSDSDESHGTIHKKSPKNNNSKFSSNMTLHHRLKTSWNVSPFAGNSRCQRSSVFFFSLMGYVARLCSWSQGFSKAAKKKTDSLVWCWSQT